MFIKNCHQLRPVLQPALLQTQSMQLHLRNHTISIVEELQWWVTNSPSWLPLTANLNKVKDAIELYTDASKTGWGAHISPDRSAHGPLSTGTANWRELHAIRLGLLHLFPSGGGGGGGKRVVVRTDSRTAASYVNREGGVVEGLVREAKGLLLECAWPRGLVLTAVHVRGVDNRIADRLSRIS